MPVSFILIKNNNRYSTWHLMREDNSIKDFKAWGNLSGLCKYVANCDAISSVRMIKSQAV